jgi:hypothetical protein
MDQAPNHPSPESTPGTTPAAVSPAALSAWDEYYRAASRRRRAGSGRQNLRVVKRRRLLRERVGISLAALLVGALTMAFYLVLR